MNNDVIEDLKKNFQVSQWNVDKKKGVLTFKNDLELKIKLEKECKRSKDETYSQSDWDAIFNKYKSKYFIEACFYYKGNKVDIGFTFLWERHVIIPFPVGANMLNDFYKNEYEIARAFSIDEDKFDTIMQDINIYAKHVRENI